MSIGQKIKQRRTELGWSQRELSDRMGYNNHSTITRIESGKVDVPQSRIVKFSEVLGVSIAYLMGWDEQIQIEIKEDPVNLAELHFEMIVDKDLTEIYEDLKFLDASQRKIVKDLVHSLVEAKKADA
jgi:transcriptional regulator with XRE-family HTH domain